VPILDGDGGGTVFKGRTSQLTLDELLIVLRKSAVWIAILCKVGKPIWIVITRSGGRTMSHLMTMPSGQQYGHRASVKPSDGLGNFRGLIVPAE